MECKICKASNFTLIYDGPIRSGGVDSVFVQGHPRFECEACGVGFVSAASMQLCEFYESADYR